jgi:hypothetical protein
MTSSSNIDLAQADPSRIPDNLWEFQGYADDGQSAIYYYWVDKTEGIYFQKKQFLQENELFKLNKFQREESESKRFGDGQSVARIPLNVFYRDIAPRVKDGDDEFMKWWLNHEDNVQYRNFRGKL